MRVILKLLIIRAYNYPMSYNDDDVDIIILTGAGNLFVQGEI